MADGASGVIEAAVAPSADEPPSAETAPGEMLHVFNPPDVDTAVHRSLFEEKPVDETKYETLSLTPPLVTDSHFERTMSVDVMFPEPLVVSLKWFIRLPASVLL